MPPGKSMQIPKAFQHLTFMVWGGHFFLGEREEGILQSILEYSRNKKVMTSHFGCISYSRSIQSFSWKDLKFALIIKTTRFYVCMLHLYSSSKMDSDPNLPVQHMLRTSLSPIYYLFLPFGNTLLQYYYTFRPVAVVSRQNSNPRSSSPSRFQSLQSWCILKEEEEEQSHILCQCTRSISGNFLLW